MDSTVVTLPREGAFNGYSSLTHSVSCEYLKNELNNLHIFRLHFSHCALVPSSHLFNCCAKILFADQYCRKILEICPIHLNQL